MPATPSFVFRKHDNIGSADADQDKKFLAEAFVDNGELGILQNVDDARFIVLGRTGSGKTALLNKVFERQERVIQIKPDNLALTYLSNNSVIRFFNDLQIKMDLFYRLLWRHVFAVELIKRHYNVESDVGRDSFLQQISNLLNANTAKREAISYLREWGDSFWQSTEYRIKEITTKLEEDFKASLGSEIKANLPTVLTSGISTNVERGKSLSEEQKAEVIKRGQEVVNNVQMKKLSEIMEILNKNILTDNQKRYYITIDKLDENWINDDLRYHLIAALLETAADFNKSIDNVKIVVALREDLIDRVFRQVRSAGYQEEKYQSMYIEIGWSRRNLEVLLDKRVNQLIREQYTTATVGARQLLPAAIHLGNGKKTDSLDYLLDRTLLRPRDIIAFFNDCITAAEGRTQILQSNIFEAEANYSTRRLRALADEWAVDYKNLIEMALCFKGYKARFKFKDIERESFQVCALQLVIEQSSKQDEMYAQTTERLNRNEIEELLKDWLKILFRVGMLGAKFPQYKDVSWSYLGRKLPLTDIEKNTAFYVHPAFWKALDIKATGE